MIGQNIKLLREMRNWSQETLARKMGYKSKSTINKIENNVNDINQTTLDKFAEVFNCDPTEIINVPGRTEPLVAHHPVLPSYDFEGEEQRIIEAYRKADSLTKAMVLRTLGLEGLEKREYG